MRRVLYVALLILIAGCLWQWMTTARQETRCDCENQATLKDACDCALASSSSGPNSNSASSSSRAYSAGAATESHPPLESHGLYLNTHTPSVSTLDTLFTTTASPRTSFTAHFPGTNTSEIPHELHSATWCYSQTIPLSESPFPSPVLIHVNIHLSHAVGMVVPATENGRKTFAQLLSGYKPIQGAHYTSALYGGHLFGNWSGALGDGRVVTIGEVHAKADWTTLFNLPSAGEPSNHAVEVQLKGIGRTTYARDQLDGRTVLRSCIREYLASEALHALGVPTARSLTLVGSDNVAYRDVMNDGNGKLEKIAVVSRTAPSFIRFGSFEYFHHNKDFAMVRQLADYVIEHFYVNDVDRTSENSKYASFYRAVVCRTARLMAHWQSVGFAHGNMNTDDMSIIGITIDYGPFAFMSIYNPSLVPNVLDRDARYAFNQQVGIAKWNLGKLAEALSSLAPFATLMMELEEHYVITYEAHYYGKMLQKIGLFNIGESAADDRLLLDELLELMTMRADYGLFFRKLSRVSFGKDLDNIFELAALFLDRSELFMDWMARYRKRLGKEVLKRSERRKRMESVNPTVVLRNHILQDVIEQAENGKFEHIQLAMEIIQHPFQVYHSTNTSYTETAPIWPKLNITSSS